MLLYARHRCRLAHPHQGTHQLQTLYNYAILDRLALLTKATDYHKESAIEFLWFVVAWYASHGIKVERVLADNGACHKPWKFRDACQELGVKHKHTQPYHPQTNGKAERFIRTALKE